MIQFEGAEGSLVNSSASIHDAISLNFPTRIHTAAASANAASQADPY
jgi:hypothetical protein